MTERVEGVLSGVSRPVRQVRHRWTERRQMRFGRQGNVPECHRSTALFTAINCIQIMDVSTVLILDQPPANIERIIDFEKTYDLKIPAEYRNFLLQSDGAEVSGQIQHPIINDWMLMLYSRLASIDDLINGMISLKQYQDSDYRLQYIDSIIEIGGTHDGPSIFMGCKGEITGKIYLNDSECDTGMDLTENNEFPIFLIADSFSTFLSLIKPYEFND
ncbi:SMI1/KNR4 family protein [Fibrella forsythiae]|uniref:SMI1/KNR4 family protein n=1 Tax=Fibrella forsythiae TaxID=2817061 RepID=A0ABS3JL18_9BACT|nr:SMI1/KNR4 family protein [Fibrella forsythiae]MBO0950690.1 SMI1/KNR4 family protein [Fibrella forsythiae]